MGYFLNDNTQFYSHGNFVSKQVEGGFYFRNPNTRSGVFATTNDEGEDILLVGDMLDAQDGVLDGSAACPDVRVSDGVVADDAAWNHVLNDPNCFTFQKLFPGGFTPQFGAFVLDASGVAGIKGTSGDLAWDASASWGMSNMDFYMYNTVNRFVGAEPAVQRRRHLTGRSRPGLHSVLQAGDLRSAGDQLQLRSLVFDQRNDQHCERRRVAERRVRDPGRQRGVVDGGSAGHPGVHPRAPTASPGSDRSRRGIGTEATSLHTEIWSCRIRTDAGS